MRPDWMSAQDAADALHVSRPRIHQLVQANVLDGTHVGGRLLVQRRSVEIRRRAKDQRRVEMMVRPTMRGLREHKAIIDRIAKIHVDKNVRVFGSTMRGDARPEIDIDLLIDLEPGRGALDVAGLAMDLEETLGRRVDVIVDDGTPSARALAASSAPIG